MIIFESFCGKRTEGGNRTEKGFVGFVDQRQACVVRFPINALPVEGYIIGKGQPPDLNIRIV